MSGRIQRFPRFFRLSILPLLVLILVAAARGKGNAKQPRTDCFGDSLPPGAIARLGTLRLRHDSGILALAFSPDGKTLASAGADNRVSIWDAATGKELHRLPKVENAVKTVVFSPDGKLLALVTKEGRIIYLYDAATGKEIRKVKLDKQGTETLAFSPDGKFLAWGGDKTVHLWDVDAAEEIKPLTGFGKKIGSLSFTPDGKSLLVGSSTDDPHSTVGEISRRDLTTGKEIRRFKVAGDGGSVDEAGAVRLAVLSPDGKHLIAIGEDDALRCWELSSGEEIWRLRKADGQWMALGVSPDGKLLAVANGQRGEGGVVKLCNAATGRVLRRLQGLTDLTTSIVFSPDGKVIAAAGWYRGVRFFDPATGLELPRARGHQAEVHTAVFCRNGERVATGAEDGSFRIWETATGKELRRIDSSGERCCKVASFDGKHLILMEDSSLIRIWDVVGDKELRRREVPGKMPWKRSFSDAGETAILDKRHHYVQIWNAITGEMRRQKDTQGISALRAILSPDGSVLATNHLSSPLRVWDVGSGKARDILDATDKFVFARDGKTLAYRNAEGVCLWETVTGKERGRLRGGRAIACFAFSPDGRLVASGGTDGTIRLWDPAAGRELASSSAHRGGVHDLSFSLDGKQLVSAGEDTTALVWDVEGMLPAQPPAREATAKELQALWSDLASEDAARAYRAIHALRSAGSPAMRLLADRLLPPKEGQDIARLVTDLDSDVFATREAATRQLEKLGPQAEAHMRAKLKERPSLEMRKRLERLLQRLEDEAKRGPQGEMLRSLRALETLEQMRTREARAVLADLAKGAAETRLTREAKACLARMDGSSQSEP